MTEANWASRETWLHARKTLLAEEKAFTQARDRLSEARRALPLVRVEKDYSFDTEHGRRNLGELFAGRSQLIAYHFMFGPDWREGCQSCSFWADNYDGIDVHLAARDTTLVCVSNAALDTLLGYRKRMGWRFAWVSAGGCDFSADFGVTFAGGQPGPVGGYNYTDRVFAEELPGLSVFRRFDDGTIGHSYSTYGRGLDAFNTAYQLLDLTPKGRDEQDLSPPMAWVRRRDQY